MELQIVKKGNELFLDLFIDEVYFGYLLVLSKNGMSRGLMWGNRALSLAEGVITDED